MRAPGKFSEWFRYKLLPKIRRALELPPLVTVLLFVATTVLCITALNHHGSHPVFELFIYLASVYSLAALIVGLGGISREFMRRVHGSKLYRWIEGEPIAMLFISDFRFRGEVSLYQGLLVSTLFAVFKGIAALFYLSAWFAAVAFYYLFFGLTRLFLVRNYRKAERLEDKDDRLLRELHGCRQCGCLMLAVNLGMTLMAVQLIREEHTVAYPGSVIYITAAYTIYILTLSIMNVVRSKRLNSPILSVSKALNLAGALMSLFTLQNALTSLIGREDSNFRMIMNLAVGTAVCASVFAMAVYIIVHSTVSMKKLERETPCT